LLLNSRRIRNDQGDCKTARFRVQPLDCAALSASAALSVARSSSKSGGKEKTPPQSKYDASLALVRRFVMIRALCEDSPSP
jgi:hypothetical protein